MGAFKKCTWPNNTTRAVKLNKILDTLVFVHIDVVVDEVFGQNFAVFKLDTSIFLLFTMKLANNFWTTVGLSQIRVSIYLIWKVPNNVGVDKFGLKIDKTFDSTWFDLSPFKVDICEDLRTSASSPDLVQVWLYLHNIKSTKLYWVLLWCHYLLLFYLHDRQCWPKQKK